MKMQTHKCDNILSMSSRRGPVESSALILSTAASA